MLNSRPYSFKKPFKRFLAGVLDGAGGLIFGRPQKPLPPLEDLRRLLVIRLDHLGDVIGVLPLIHQISLLKPKPYLALGVSPAGAELLRDTPGIDQWITFNAPWFSRGSASKSRGFGSLDLIRLIRKGRFDASFDLRGDLRHHVLLSLSKIPCRMGYGVTGGAFLLTYELEWRKGLTPAESNLEFLKAFNQQPADSVPTLNWTPRPDEVAWLHQMVSGRDFMLFHIDAGTPAKRWPSDRYVPLIDKARRAGLLPILIGSNPNLSQNILKQTPEAIDLLGKTTLAQMVTLISRARGIVSTDSGPAHIAAALKKPALILWSGTSDPALWKPRGERIFHVQAHVPCEYCGQEICPLPEQICMTHLTPDQAMPVLEEVLQS